MGKNMFIQFCLKGLEKMYIQSENIFATSLQLSGDRMLHVRDHNPEYKFTMNALMGLNEAKKNGYEVFLDIESDYHCMAKRIDKYVGAPLDIAATIWTGRCIDTDIPAKAMSLFHDLLKNASQMKNLGPKALAWSILACLQGEKEYYETALALAKLAVGRYIHAVSGLVRQNPTGLDRSWAPFGAQSYMAYAFLLLARRTENEWAKNIGLLIARRLVKLQGPSGQWGWMYHVPSGRVADYYPVFSVHQYGYAPFFLLEAIDQGYEEFRVPLVRGFQWILGHNEMGQSMVEPMHQIVWRRIFRKGMNTRLIKAFRAMIIIHGGLKPGIKEAHALEIDHQCWGFEMALPLYIFSNRDDFSEILNDSSLS
jgi:hypothetical protein